MQVVITLSEDIADVDGVTLGSEQIFYFTTIYTPLYSSVRKVRLEIGAYITNVVDDTINLAIFEASLEADQISFNQGNETEFFRFARKEWVTCKACLLYTSPSPRD